ncbi:MAG: hypothetical protein KF884_05215 [Fimbriimonadaceae bacterium]|nr:hypothetical protein [Fimbriimonadaceae bacterium]QYK59484.1 MAG: hypothetical protein KF884_05215 [Fimbriimonadaceae bacterium]
MNALVWAAFAASSLTTTVSFESKAQNLGRLSEELAAQTGLKLKVSSELSREIVAVRFHEADPEEALAKVAEAVDGKWVESGDTRTLMPDSEAWRAETNRWQKEWRAGIKGRLDQWADELAKNGAFDADKAYQELSSAISQFEAGGVQGMRGRGNTMQRLVTGNPGGRAISKIATSLGPDALAGIRPGERVVFSTSPTRMQRALPGNSATLVRDFLAEQRAWTTKLASSPRDGIRGFFAGNIDSQNALVNGTPAKTFLIVNRSEQGDNLTLSLVVANDQGQAMANGFSVIVVDRDQEGSQSDEKSGEDPQVELSAESLEAAKLFATSSGGLGGPMQFAMGGGPVRGGNIDVVMVGGPAATPRAKTPAAWIEKFADPVANEPLGWHVSDALLGAAKSENKNLVAYLPDHVAVSVARAMNANMTAGSIYAVFSAQGMKVSQGGGWTLVTPTWKSEARDSRVDRGSLKALLQAGRKAGTFRLGELANYARKAGADSGLDSALSSLIDPALAQDLRQVYGQNGEALRFFGLLGPAHRPMFGTGKPLALSSVGPQGSSILYNMVFNSLGGPDIQRPNDAREQRVEIQGVAGAMGGRGRGGPMMFQNMSDLTRERTEILPNGLPSMVSFKVDVQTQPGVKAIESATGVSRHMSAQQMAGMRALADNPNIPANVRRGPQWDGYIPTTETEYRITWEIAPGITMTRELSDRNIDGNTGPVAYDKLPAAFQNQVADLAARMSERMNNRRGDGPGERRGRQPGAGRPTRTPVP